nr:MAG TPA: YopX protein [Caudoviricetes sp.]
MIPKFRGLSIDENSKGQWQYGHLIEDRGRAFIINEVVEANEQYITIGSWCPVDPKTIGQSMGLKDKNGKEIFKGDIIRTNAYGCIVGFGEYTYFEDEHTQTTEIGFYLSFLNVTPATYAPFDRYYWGNCEVIGNIYENELDLIVYEAHKYNKLRRKNEK